MNLMRRSLVIVVGLGCAGCAGSLDITRAVSANDAAGESLSAQAILRDGERIELPAGTHVRAGRAVLAEKTSANVALEAGDEVVREGDRITAIRSHGVVTAHFASAELVDRATVRGEMSDIPLRATDSVEVRGTFAPGDELPGGGRVESTRSTGALVGGLTSFALAYAPSAYVGSQSSMDRALLAPVIGPWLDLANRPSCSTSSQIALAASSVGVDPCIGDTATRVALVVSGVVQGLGVLVTMFGLPAHSEVGASSRSLRVAVVPTGLGGALVGTF